MEAVLCVWLKWFFNKLIETFRKNGLLFVQSCSEFSGGGIKYNHNVFIKSICSLKKKKSQEKVVEITHT